jgi:hypothetical protein
VLRRSSKLRRVQAILDGGEHGGTLAPVGGEDDREPRFVAYDTPIKPFRRVTKASWMRNCRSSNASRQLLTLRSRTISDD